MTSSSRLEQVVLVVTASCTVMLTVLGVRRQFALDGAQTAQSGVSRPERVADWTSVVSGGRLMGDSGAKVLIVEFMDFECPACRAFVTSERAMVRSVFGPDVAFIHRHFPLTTIHRLAMPLAVASECAADQGRFNEFHDAVFAQADSLGLKTIEAFARDAGVSDLAEFKDCTKSGGKESLVAKDMAEGRRIGVIGTPTIIVNGMKLAHRDSATIVDEIRSAMAKTRAVR